MRISASVYAFGERELEHTVARLDAFGVDYLHVDCNDDPGVFEDIARIRAVSRTPIDLHLVTPEPEAYFEGVRRHRVELCCFQYEDAPRPVEVPEDLGARMGLSILPDTSVEVFEPYADRFAFLMVMTTVPGRSGGRFDDGAFAQIRRARRRYPAKAIHVDGGVDAEVSYILRNLDVQLAVSGSFLRKSDTVGSALLTLKARLPAPEHRVRDFMAWPSEIPLVTRAGAELSSVLTAIDDARRGYCVVVDAQGRLEGVITDGDVRRALMRALGEGGKITHAAVLALDTLLNPRPLTVPVDATVAEMLALIEAHVGASGRPVTFLPVVDAGRRVRGVVSFDHLLRSAA